MRRVFAQCGREVNLVILLLDQNLANLFFHSELAERLTLTDPIAIISNSSRSPYSRGVPKQYTWDASEVRTGFGVTRWHFAEIVNITRNNESMALAFVGHGWLIGQRSLI